MPQSAAERPIPNVQRKAAIASGRAQDHAGKVRVEPIAGFDATETRRYVAAMLREEVTLYRQMVPPDPNDGLALSDLALQNVAAQVRRNPLEVGMLVHHQPRREASARY